MTGIHEQETNNRNPGIENLEKYGKEGQKLNRKPSILGTLKLETNDRELKNKIDRGGGEVDLSKKIIICCMCVCVCGDPREIIQISNIR